MLRLRMRTGVMCGGLALGAFVTLACGGGSNSATLISTSVPSNQAQGTASSGAASESSATTAPTAPPATVTPKPKPTPQPQQIVPTTAPTTAPVANLDGTWVGTTSVGGTIDFVVSNGRVTNIHFAFPASIEPSKEGDCSANGSWAGYESWLNQLRITIGTDGSFSGRNIQIRGLDRLLAEFSGSLTSSGSASGRLREEITASETCKIISSFDWSATK